jgi:hypothetical protein
MQKINVIIPLPYSDIHDTVLTGAMIEAVATNTYDDYYDTVSAYNGDDELTFIDNDEVSINESIVAPERMEEVKAFLNLVTHVEQDLMPVLRVMLTDKVCNLFKMGYTIYDIGNHHGNTMITLADPNIEDDT